MQKTTPSGRWTLITIRQKSPEPSYWEVMDSLVLLAYASLAASWTLLQWLLLNFTLNSEDLFFWYKQKKVISWNYGSSTKSWRPWRWARLGLIFTMRDICINYNLNPLTQFTSSRSTEFKDILPCNISQMITKTISVSIPFWIWWKVNGNQDNSTRVSKWRESHCRTNTSIRRNK